MLGPAYLEGTYSEIYPDKSEDAEGMQKFFKQFSFPGHIGSHVTPETPGSIHEGGELGYSLSHAYGMAFDNPDLIVACVVGDGEAETGPLATAWHSNKFINPVRDGAVLPILNLNGYKIANPTILARISHEELEALFVGYGYKPYFVEGERSGADAPEDGRDAGTRPSARSARSRKRRANRRTPYRPRWPMIVLRSPKGWTGPKEIKGHKVEGSWRSHQVPFSDVRDNPANLKVLEDWMRSYKPEELFDANGRLVPELQALAPKGNRRMSANPHANGGLLRKELKLPDFRNYAVEVPPRGSVEYENTKPLGEFLRDVMKQHDQLPRLRSGRDRFEPAAGCIRGQQEDLDGRHAAGRRRRRRAFARRAGDGDAFRAHAARLARRVSAHRPPRLLPYLRSLRPRHRLYVQPARQVAGYLQEPRAVARAGGVREHPAVVDRLAPGP